MVSGEEKPSLLEASCCIELVVNGAGACDFAIAFFTLETIYSPFSSSFNTFSVSSADAGLYFFMPFFSRSALNGECFFG